MYKSFFYYYTYNWFCGPGSHRVDVHAEVNLCITKTKFIKIDITVKMFGAFFFVIIRAYFKLIVFYKGSIKLIKSDSKYIYNVAKYFYFK